MCKHGARVGRAMRSRQPALFPSYLRKIALALLACHDAIAARDAPSYTEDFTEPPAFAGPSCKVATKAPSSVTLIRPCAPPPAVRCSRIAHGFRATASFGDLLLQRSAVAADPCIEASNCGETSDQRHSLHVSSVARSP